MKALIFDIKRFAIHDGPGIRTTVFFKGCPLRCPWCHNPEGVESSREVIAYDERCIWCGDCVEACPDDAISIDGGTITIDRDRCTLCGECESVCPSQAVRVVGREVGLEELMDEIERDRVFYEQSNGGVTFSGGEPLMQCGFLVDILKECKARGIHTVCDTSGYGSRDCIIETARHTDLFLYDLKHMDGGVHERFTGVSNDRILENLKVLSSSGADVLVRIPVVRGFNDSVENAEKTADFLSTLRGIVGVSILKYHGAWVGKFRSLGKSSEPYLSGDPSGDTLEKIKGVFEKHGFSARISG